MIVLAGLLFLVFIKIRVFSYTYDSIFPTQIAMSPYKGNGYYDSNQYLIHSKLYIIDDKEVYLGSLNFTKASFRKNYESRIKIDDLETVKLILNEFNYLFDNKNTDYKNIAEIGKTIYSEPIN